MMVMVMMAMVTKRFSIIILSKVEAHLVGPLGKISMAIIAMMITMTVLELTPQLLAQAAGGPTWNFPVIP